MLKICSFMDRLGGNYLDFENSCLAVKAPLFSYVRHAGQKWRWKRKVEWELECVKQFPDDHFIFLDAYDTLCVGDVPRMEEIVAEQDLLLPAERYCFPALSEEILTEYEYRREVASPWKFVNGAGPAGKGSKIKEAIEWGMEEFLWVGRNDDDQAFWTYVYLYGGFGVLDQKCKLTCHMYGANSGDLKLNEDQTVTNMITNENPQFLHAACKTWEEIPEELIPPRRDPRA